MKKFFKEHDLVKILSLMLLLIVICSWIIPTGSFGTGGAFTESEELGRIGLVHFFYGFTFAIQNYSIQIAFLLMVGIFYGVISKTDGYKALVLRLAKFFKGREIVVALVLSFVIAGLSSILNNTFVMIVFMPFLITVLRRMNFSKMSAFATTFGSILVGVLGATIGTEGLLGFIQYMGYVGSEITFETELWVRVGIFALAYILFNFFNVTAIKKLDKKVLKEENDDLFQVEEPKKKRVKVWPIIVCLVIVFVYAVLGFLSWTEVFELELFTTFHEKVMSVAIGDFEIFKALLGTTLPNMSYDLVTEFGTWYLFTYSIVLGVITAIVAIVSRMKLNDFFANAWDGIKKFLRPTLFILLAYMVFVFLYWSPIMPTVLNQIGGLSSSFNPFVSSLQAFLGSIFNSDLAYLGYSLSYYLGSFSGNEGNVLFLIYSTIYGLVQFVTPISVFLLFGLSYMDIPYKNWLKYIWKFFVGMLLCLLVIFALLTWI